MNNPFVYGIATDVEHFTDRLEETERLTLNLTNKINTILISPRRLGKTSLVNKVASQLKERKEILVVQIDAFACRNEEDFYRLFATEIIKQISTKTESLIANTKKFLSNLVPKISIGQDSEISFSLETTNNKYDSEVLNLPEVIAIERGVRIVVCIDEFQQIGEFIDSLSFQKKLRSVWQLQKNTSYCLFGSKRHVLMNMFGKASHPFYKFGDVMFLEKIPTNYWVEYIQQQFRKTQKDISKDLCENICLFVESNSSYVQHLAWLLWARTENVATKEDLILAQQDLLRQNHVLFLKYVNELSAYQVNVVRAIADGHTMDLYTGGVIKQYNLGSTANVARVIQALESKEIVEVTGKKVELSDPIFGRWVQKNLNSFFKE
ncbi:MAG: P-loop NTPase fold protein [Bacteroidales bacterium]|nr:P-loop NTPase fold protein [Bacteroidales bacterium]